MHVCVCSVRIFDATGVGKAPLSQMNMVIKLKLVSPLLVALMQRQPCL